MDFNYKEFNRYCKQRIESEAGARIAGNIKNHRARLFADTDTRPLEKKLNKKVIVKRWRDYQSHENLLIDLENEISKRAIWVTDKSQLQQAIKKDIYDRDAKNVVFFRTDIGHSVESENITNLKTIEINETSIGRTYNIAKNINNDCLSYPIVSKTIADLSDFYQNKYGFDPGGSARKIISKHHSQIKEKLNDCDYIILEAAIAVSKNGLFVFYDNEGSLLQLIDKVGRGIVILKSSSITENCDNIDELQYLRARNRTGNSRYPQMLILRGNGCLNNFTIVISDDTGQTDEEYRSDFYYSERDQKKFYDPLFLTTGDCVYTSRAYSGDIDILDTEYCLLDGWRDHVWPFQGEYRKQILRQRLLNVTERKTGKGFEKILVGIWKRYMLKRARLNKLGKGISHQLIKQYTNIFGSGNNIAQRPAEKSFNKMWREREATQQ